MLELNMYATEDIDDKTGEILVTFHGPKVWLEHSLLSLSEWEAKYRKPFLKDDEKSPEEILDYIGMMVVKQEGDEDFVSQMTQPHVKKIVEYISSTPTATWFNDRNQKKPSAMNTEVTTSELIYYWMFSLRISKECETWNLNRLLTLIKVFDAKEKKPEKMSKRDIMSQNKALNAQRRAKLKSKG